MKPVRVKFGKKVVIFRHAKATAATHAARVRAGKRLARMWTNAERMENLRKAWRANGIHVKSNPGPSASRSAAGKRLAKTYGFFRTGDAIYQRRPGQPAKLIRRL